MVMSWVHLPGQIQLPISPSLALEDVGAQGSLGVSVLKRMSMSATPEQRSLEIWCEKDKPTAAYPRNWEPICRLNIKPGLSK